MGPPNLMWVTWHNHAPFRTVCSLYAGTSYDRPVYQISILYVDPLQRYERRRKMQKLGWFWMVRGHPRSSETWGFDRAHMTSNSTLIKKYASNLYRFRVIECFPSKVVNFNLPHLHLSSPYGVIQDEFCRDLWRQKTRVPGLSCGIICVILRLGVLIQYPSVTDRQTHRRTTTAYTAISIASRGKNWRIWSNISGSTGPIFAIFTPYKSALRADDGPVPYFFPICQGTLPWQPYNVAGRRQLILHAFFARSPDGITDLVRYLLGGDITAPNWLYARLFHAFLVFFLSLMIYQRQIISGSAGTIFAIFSPNESVLGADDQSRPLFFDISSDVAMANIDEKNVPQKNKKR